MLADLEMGVLWPVGIHIKIAHIIVNRWARIAIEGKVFIVKDGIPPAGHRAIGKGGQIVTSRA